jgi:hypothetical protein
MTRISMGILADSSFNPRRSSSAFRSGAAGNGLKQNWKDLSGEVNHVVLAYGSSATVKATDKTPAQATSNDYLFVLRLEDERVAEVWANGSTTNKAIEP